jgi:hypothetical protein
MTLLRTRASQQAKFLADVEHLAEAAVETAEQLHASGLGHLARELEKALARLGD